MPANNRRPLPASNFINRSVVFPVTAPNGEGGRGPALVGLFRPQGLPDQRPDR